MFPDTSLLFKSAEPSAAVLRKLREWNWRAFRPPRGRATVGGEGGRELEGRGQNGLRPRGGPCQECTHPLPAATASPPLRCTETPATQPLFSKPHLGLETRVGRGRATAASPGWQSYQLPPSGVPAAREKRTPTPKPRRAPGRDGRPFALPDTGQEGLV